MRKPSVIIILIVLVCGIVAAGTTLNVLALRDSKSSQIIFLRVVKPGDTFLLKYLHSVELSDVWERFVIDSDYELVLTETRFRGQGAGLPTNLSGDEHLVRENGWFIITGMKRKLPLIYWRVQHRWRDRFRFENGPEIDFSKQIGDVLILIEVEEMKAITWLYFRSAAAFKNFMKVRP